MGHLLVVAKQRLLLQEVRTTLWFGGNDATMANAQAIVDEIADNWNDNIKTSMTTDWELYAFDVYDKTIPSVPGVEFTPTGGGFAGTSAVDPLPTQIALLVTFKAQVAPPNTNRKYLGGYTDAAIIDGLWIAAAIADAVLWADRMIDIGTQTSLAIVMEVVELLSDGTVSGSNPLENARAVSVPATQRRRRIGIGS